MPDFHRLVPPTYLGGVPATHDEINNASSGVPALADVVKGLGPNVGSYFIAFGEDGTSLNGNRSHVALANNTDYLDNIINIEVPVVDNVDVTAGGGGDATLVIAGDVFMGKSGTANNQLERDRLIKVVDQTTGNDVIDASGVTVKASLIHNGAAASQVGVPATGFFTGPTINFSPTIPAATTYRVFFGRRSSYRDVSLDKTRLDAFTRQVIQGSHQVAGEAVRFIRETARRSGGSGSAVTALAASIIETPGLGENILAKSNTMTMDVDPDESFAFNGAFAVRYHRDGIPKILFSVLEGAGAGVSVWQNTAERISLSDVNVLASGFGTLRVPFSSGVEADGDAHLRLFEEDPGAEAQSILKRLNAAPFVTCGDGLTSFGDFNGASALGDAIAFASGAGFDDIHIKLKRGSYDVSNLDIGGGPANVIIEGVTKGTVAANGAVINNTAALGATSAGIISSANLDRIEFRNITFVASSTSELAWYSESCFVRFEDCQFTGQAVRFDVGRDLTVIAAFGFNIFEMKNCYMQVQVGTTPPLHFAVTDTVANPNSRGFLIEDCVILCGSDIPALRIEDLGLSSTAYIDGILFNRCNVQLDTTSDDGGGDMTGNSSLLELVPGSVSNLSMRRIEWRDCDVLVQGAGAMKPLLYARFKDGGNSILTTNLDLKISGGRWEIPTSSSIGPVYIGWDTYNVGSTSGKVTIENLEWGYTTLGQNNGGPTTEVAGPATADWAFAFIGILEVRMRNVTWLKNTGLSDSGDLFCNNVRRYDIDGLYLGSNNWSPGSGASPSFRIKFVGNEFIQFSQSKISNIMIGSNLSAVDGATVGVVVLQPNVESGPTKYTHQMVVSNLHINGFSGGIGAGIFMAGGTATGNESDNLHLVDCLVDDVGGPGFHFLSPNTSNILKGLSIRGCEFRNCDYGILIDIATGGTAMLGNVHISGCMIERNTNEGILVDVATSEWDDEDSGVILMGNFFHNNNGGIDNVQVRLIGGATIVGAAYGNVATNVGAGGTGSISQPSGPADAFRGSETSYTYIGDGSGSAIEQGAVHITTLSTAAAHRRNHAPGNECLHNRMDWTNT